MLNPHVRPQADAQVADPVLERVWVEADPDLAASMTVLLLNELLLPSRIVPVTFTILLV